MPVFILEYIVRLYASGTIEKHKGIKGKIRYETVQSFVSTDR